MRSKQAGQVAFMLIVTSVLLSVTLAAMAEAQATKVKPLAKSMTVISVQDPWPGHQAHQLAILLPPQASQLFTGTLTYTASKPVEVVVFHAYRPEKEPPVEHGTLVIVQIDGKPYAASVMQFSNEVKATNSATIAFTGNRLALHTLSGDKFTAAVSIQAIQEPISR